MAGTPDHAVVTLRIDSPELARVIRAARLAAFTEGFRRGAEAQAAQQADDAPLTTQDAYDSHIEWENTLVWATPPTT